MTAYEPERWTDFAVAAAGASAALAGLLFVAVSINLSVVLGVVNLPARAAYTLTLLATPVFLSLALLVPGQPAAALATELLVLAAFAGVLMVRAVRPSRRVREQPFAAWVGVGLVPASVIPVATVLAAVGLLTDALGGLYWIAGAVVVALLAGLINAWALLVEIVRP